MSDILACPFCREMYRPGEVFVCPTCGLPLSPLNRLPPSYEVAAEEQEPEPPEHRPLALHYWRRGRGLLVLCGIAGVAAFFLPWIHVSIPELTTFSGFGLARRLGWSWGCLIGWVTLVPTVLSRRTINKMRGARLAAAMFCSVPLMTTIVLALNPPHHALIPIRFTYGFGYYMTLAVSVLGLLAALGFGGRIEPAPASEGSDSDHSLN